jgi:adenine-specific DNA-methyltransferase
MREKQPMTVEHWSKLPATPKDPRVAAVLDKMAATGISLQEYCKGQMYSGIATGLNAAFVLDQRTRDLLVAGDPQGAAILKPFLKARDIKPWRVEWPGSWLIYAYPGIDIQHYPTVLDYLHTFKLRLEQRRGKFAWYELSRPRENSKTAMEQPKLIYPGISNLPKIALDDLGRYYVGHNVCFIPGTDRYLQGVLGSRVLWFYLANTASPPKPGYYRLSMRNMKNLPIPTPAGAERVGIAHLVERLSEEHCPGRLNLETELNDRVAYLYGLTTEEELHIVEGLPLAPLTAESEDVR